MKGEKKFFFCLFYIAQQFLCRYQETHFAFLVIATGYDDFNFLLNECEKAF